MGARVPTRNLGASGSSAMFHIAGIRAADLLSAVLANIGLAHSCASTITSHATPVRRAPGARNSVAKFTTCCSPGGIRNATEAVSTERLGKSGTAWNAFRRALAGHQSL